MNKNIVVIIICLMIASNAYAQRLSVNNKNNLIKLEDSLKTYAKQMGNDDIEFIYRFKADSVFTKTFVQALKTNNSFYYKFDSVPISKLYSSDSSFRIFTWEVMKDFTYYRQRGAIQFKTKDGSLKLIPLLDGSDYANQLDSVRTNKNWIGAVYYNMIEKTFNNKKYYTLLGSDGNNARSKKKWIEVLTFDNEMQPHFGGKFFQYKFDEIKPKPPVYRFCLEFKKEAQVRLNYDKNLDAIVFDHLYSEEHTPEIRYTLVPYGEYESFKFINGIWVHSNTPFENAPLKNNIESDGKIKISK